MTGGNHSRLTRATPSPPSGGKDESWRNTSAKEVAVHNPMLGARTDDEEIGSSSSLERHAYLARKHGSSVRSLHPIMFAAAASVAEGLGESEGDESDSSSDI